MLGALGVLPRQGPPWEPDNVMVETAEGGLLWGTCWALLGPGQLCSPRGGCAGLGLPAGSGSLAWVASGVRHGSALGGKDLQVRESVPHLSSLSSLCGSQPHLLPLSHVTGCEPSIKMALAYHFQCFHLCGYI